MIAEVLRRRLRALARVDRLGQFVSVGVAGAALETILVFVLTGLYSAPPLAGKAVGAEASITLMFFLNDRYTFSEAGGVGALALLRRYLTSHVVRLGGLAVAFATLYVLTSWTSIEVVVAGANLWPTIANGVGIAAGMVLNYVAESLLTWRVQTA